ncbi:MAG: Yip1 family protein [Bacteroidales bacterium]
MDENGFDFKKLIDDSKETLLNPKSYFASMQLGGGMGQPLIKALIYSVIAAVFTLIWSFLVVGGIAGGVFGSAVGIGAFFATIIGGIIGVFIAALIILLISSICNGNNDFEASLRVAASLMVIFPISALLSVFKFNYYLGTIINLAVNLYSLYLLYIAISIALKGKEQTAKIIAYVLGGLLILFFIIGLAGGAALRHGIKMGASKYERELSKIENEMEKAAKDMSAQYENESEDAESEEADKYAKPDEFPSKALGEVQEYLSTGKPVLSEEKLQRLFDATSELQDYDESQGDEISKVLSKHGYSSMLDYTSDMVVAASGFAAVASLNAMENMKNSSKEEQKSAEMFQMDKALKAAASQSISLAKLTEKDLYTIYENWDLAVNLDKKSKKE